MTKIDIFSGFLGAGKTTLIKKLISEAYRGEKLVLIENEFGEIGVDGGFMKDAGINVTEMNSGCICCSLVGDFADALHKVIEQYAPDRVIIEPSGVGKLSDVIRAVQTVLGEDVCLNACTTVVDANRCKMYIKNFGEFFGDQIGSASTVILSHTKGIADKRLDECVATVRGLNENAVLITTDWDSIDGAQILSAMERKDSLKAELSRLAEEHEHEHCHHDHDHHHEHECCHHDHDHDHDHDHHHHHHADEVFDSFGVETVKKFTKAELKIVLGALSDEAVYGVVVRAKGIVEGDNGEWIHFDYVPGEADIRTGSADVTGKLCVIGSKIDKDKIRRLFNV
ncbi:MAG: CobW family GTP-binding protein [Acutalibacteraceae bacterium]